MKNINRNFILTILIFMLALSFRIYWISQKHGFHVDEIFSKGIISGKSLIKIYYANSNSIFYRGKDIKNFYFKHSKQSLLKDLKKLRINNYYDDSHPSLYYSLLRIALNFSDHSPKDFIHFGCGLNILFFIFSFFIMRKLLIRLFGDNKLVPIGLAVAFLNTGSISMTLFIRPYELQILAYIFISYIYLIIKDKLKNDEDLLNIKNITIISSSLAFVFLSGYYLALYVAFLGGLLLFYARKNSKNIFTLLTSAILSILLTLFIYNGYFLLFESQRFDYYLKNITYYFLLLKHFLFYSSVLFSIIIFIPFMSFKKTIKGLDLIITAIIWSIIIFLICPFFVFRYISPVVSILSIIIVNIINNIKKNKQIYISSIIIFIYILSAIIPIKSDDILKETKISNPLVGVLENLYLTKIPKLKTDLPVIIYSTNWYNPLYIIPFLNDKQQYLIKNATYYKMDLNKIQIKHYYLFVDSTDKLEYETEKLIMIPVASFSKYYCYEIINKD